MKGITELFKPTLNRGEDATLIKSHKKRSKVLRYLGMVRLSIVKELNASTEIMTNK